MILTLFLLCLSSDGLVFGYGVLKHLVDLIGPISCLVGPVSRRRQFGQDNEGCRGSPEVLLRRIMWPRRHAEAYKEGTTHLHSIGLTTGD